VKNQTLVDHRRRPAALRCVCGQASPCIGEQMTQGLGRRLQAASREHAGLLWMLLVILAMAFGTGLYRHWREQRLRVWRRRRPWWARLLYRRPRVERRTQSPVAPALGWGGAAMMPTGSDYGGNGLRFPWDDNSGRSPSGVGAGPGSSSSSAVRMPFHLAGLADIRASMRNDPNDVHEICLSTERTIFDKVRRRACMLPNSHISPALVRRRHVRAWVRARGPMPAAQCMSLYAPHGLLPCAHGRYELRT